MQSDWRGLLRLALVALTLAGVPGAAFAASEEIGELSRKMVALERSGDNAGALPFAQDALALAEGTLGAAHPTVAIYLEHLGVLYRKLGHGQSAESHLRRALAIREAGLGPEHTSVGATLMQLGILYQNQERKTEAETHFQRALEIRERNHGPTHPMVATVLRHYAQLLREMDRPEDASRLEARAQAIDPSRPSLKTHRDRELTGP